MRHGNTLPWIFILAGLTGCMSPSAWGDRQVPLVTVEAMRDLDERIDTLAIETQSGHVRVIEGTGQLRMTAEVRVRKARLEGVRELDAFEDHVRVEVVDNRLTLVDSHKDAADHNDWAVSLTIAVPRRLDVAAVSGAGNVELEFVGEHIEGVSGAGNVIVDAERVTRLEATTGAGNVEVEVSSFAGTVTASAGAGNVRMKVGAAASEGRVDLNSGTGNVSLTLPDDAAGQFRTSSGMGRVTTQGLEGLERVSNGMGAAISGAVGRGGPRYHLSTGIGNVSVETR